MIKFKQYVLTDEDFENLRSLIYKTCGINLSNAKRELMHARLSKRLREIGVESFREYYQFLTRGDSKAEMVQLMDAISTNLTSFFRESEHFDYLNEEGFPEIFAGTKSSWRVRLWSAGCSTGEEPYSLGVTLLNYLHLQGLGSLDIKILGTDISTRVLKEALNGVYSEDRVVKIPEADRRRFFDKFKRGEDYYYRVKNSVKDIITFRRLNLMEPFPFKEVFDLILCRNVMIYFDRSHQESLVKKFWDCLKPRGVLMIGHSESLTGIDQAFEYVKPTIYRKKID
ncbi:MAG: protein-glutamate O-methyltransferase CheR [Pseudomonadota bacterium]